VATAFKGSLVSTRTEDLARIAVRAVVDRSGLEDSLIDDVVMAESMHGGGAVARHAAIEAGLIRAGGVALNRHCAGSLAAVAFASGSIIAGMEHAIVAGGAHSTSTTPQQTYRIPGTDQVIERWMPPTHPDSPEAPNMDMSITVGWNTAQAAGISREEMDAWALRSHERAIAAIDAGRFDAEIVPVPVTLPDGTARDFSVDEHPRRGSTLEKLASLAPLHPEIEGFSITAGNSSGMNDAASALVVASSDLAASAGVAPLAKVLGWAQIGIDPKLTGMAVIDVARKLCERTGRSLQDVALWEINEAFASVPIAACKVLGLDDETVNVSGSGCSIGHPVSASGGRMLATLIHDLKRRGGGIGVAAMCAGGGQAGAVMIEV
jgi:acetyl-CoA C-acetyltransferase